MHWRRNICVITSYGYMSLLLNIFLFLADNEFLLLSNMAYIHVSKWAIKACQVQKVSGQQKSTSRWQSSSHLKLVTPHLLLLISQMELCCRTVLQSIRHMVIECFSSIRVINDDWVSLFLFHFWHPFCHPP